MRKILQHAMRVSMPQRTGINKAWRWLHDNGQDWVAQQFFEVMRMRTRRRSVVYSSGEYKRGYVCEADYDESTIQKQVNRLHNNDCVAYIVFPNGVFTISYLTHAHRENHYGLAGPNSARYNVTRGVTEYENMLVVRRYNKRGSVYQQQKYELIVTL